MNILAFDTSTRLTEVATYHYPTGQSERECQEISAHSETLLLQIQSCLQKQGWTVKEVDAVVCGAGPGSFTGLRIGAATAKGLCFALGIPLVMVSSLDALAEEWKQEWPLLVCMNAHQGKVYAKLYDTPSGYLGDSSRCHAPPKGSDGACSQQDGSVNRVDDFIESQRRLFSEQIWEPGELLQILRSYNGEVTVCGDGPTYYPNLAQGRIHHKASAPSALCLARIGVSCILAGLQDKALIQNDVASAVPMYTFEFVPKSSGP